MRKSIIIAVSFLVCLSCKKEPVLPRDQVITNMLVNNLWTIQNVDVDNVDKTSDFSGMTLDFDPTTYVTTNGDPVWPVSGTWILDISQSETIVRDADFLITITEISDSKLVLELEWDGTLDGGRASSVSGHYIFSFTN